ncbi:nicotinate-nucleotide pyrophosphorylase [carboxylating] [Methanosarcina thermophila]|jgi:nicotinate-nucleotide pyrophosphorylase (carboxylating)|uniref:Nicotinate-nucleotide pyrophosphorylase [carboxylating] n=3 Tax=Methanosarcina thermophila TaxID=2210 RepID=A0A1I7B8J3_METTE|nr:carboxylating nicotinate-nucleotide diphosphorylase [Methanosarcina thermophila]ALK04454.1 MAG: nicotinate-nucleotide pyrophosphorylase [Methanosarcina sp. 795]AKB13093.1 Quinolinate phosphoribosyltransferase (decarboxylating) [Methanosarcina thermophila TM-1]AKB16275.1 Quinolinate phosphoribosyltransferase (decarboxylating) [Methanosarcina thermophila CHTI-55]NLU58171.1 carboxylating nicotinate-nucleotide diphosphorylase [Methanosarcina thermophila]SFT83464.1 nicotinate-nucleotide pyrophos
MLIKEVERFIEEDLGYDDVSCTIVPDKPVEAIIFTKEACVIAGIKEAESIFCYLGVQDETTLKDGDHVKEGDIIFRLKGGAVSILRAERLVLNFLGHLSGIATLTRACVDIVRKHSETTRVACTRKTTPGIRKFEKLAVAAGGGDTHRFNLSDSVMIKDNHVKLMGIEAAINAAKKTSFTRKIEVEVESAEDAVLAAKLGADIIMLDNMQPEAVRETLEILKEKGLRDSVIVEASGGISLENLENYAKTGVDVISMGSLIHKSRWIDLSLEIMS